MLLIICYHSIIFTDVSSSYIFPDSFLALLLIFSPTFLTCCLSDSEQSSVIPRYLYCYTTGMPSIFVIFHVLFFDLFIYSIPLFFLFSSILLFLHHLFMISMAFLHLKIECVTTIRSSAYA
jgi:hypothetical protein